MNPKDRKLRLRKTTLRHVGPDGAIRAVGGGPPVIVPGESDDGCTCTCDTCDFTLCDSCPFTNCLDDSCRYCPYSQQGFTVCYDLCA